MSSPIVQWLVRWVVLALGVMLATRIVPGIECNDGTTLVAVVLLLSLFNAVLKPILVLFTLPFILITLGLGVVLINALLLQFVGHLVKGFVVESFWSALGGALVISVTNLFVSFVTRGTKVEVRSRPRPGRKGKDDDVIDV
jgi:putative membrane protein